MKCLECDGYRYDCKQYFSYYPSVNDEICGWYKVVDENLADVLNGIRGKTFTEQLEQRLLNDGVCVGVKKSRCD